MKVRVVECSCEGVSVTGDSPCISHCGRGSDLKLSNVLVASDSERVVREEVENSRTKVRLPLGKGKLDE